VVASHARIKRQALIRLVLGHDNPFGGERLRWRRPDVSASANGAPQAPAVALPGVGTVSVRSRDLVTFYLTVVSTACAVAGTILTFLQYVHPRP
jgi:hypothetical protein